MIDSHTISRLHKWASEHGPVQSLTPLPAGDHRFGMVMLTMQSQEIAHRIHRKFGFTMFGYSALIIPDTWLEQHLPQAE